MKKFRLVSFHGKEAHKGVTKKSTIKKYIKETLNNKYRKSVTHFGKGLHAFMSEDASPHKEL